MIPGDGPAEPVLPAAEDLDRDGSSRREAAGSIEEISDDLLHILRLVRGLADAQSELSVRVEQLERRQAVELHNLRRDLLDDRRAQASRGAFGAIHPAVDQIEMMQATLTDADGETARFTSVLLSTLRGVLRGLGFESFSVAVGDPFDPARMECVDYTDGEQGVVLRVVRPGYEADGVVVRRCGVAIADPIAGAGDLDGGESEVDT